MELLMLWLVIGGFVAGFLIGKDTPEKEWIIYAIVFCLVAWPVILGLLTYHHLSNKGKAK